MRIECDSPNCYWCRGTSPLTGKKVDNTSLMTDEETFKRLIEEMRGQKDYGINTNPLHSSNLVKDNFSLPANFFTTILNEAYQLQARKQSDYTAGSNDPFLNYRQSADLAGISCEQAMFTRLCEKMVRISSIYRKDGQVSVEDEKVEDTLLDILIIAAHIIHERRNSSG